MQAGSVHVNQGQTRMIKTPQKLCGLLMVAGVLCSSWVCAEERVFTEGAHGKGSLRYVQNVPVLTLAGTPEEMGQQQAALVSGAIRPLLEMPRKILGNHGVKYDLVLPLAAAAARGMAGNAPQRYRTEIDTLAKAAGVDANLLYVGNSLVELRRMGGCAAFLVEPAQSATGEMLFGRNFDFPTFGVLDKYSCVMIVRPEEGHAFASVTVPGFIGVVSGMNDAGLAIATLDVYSSADGAPVFDLRGVPLALTYRRILEECSSVEEAQTLLESTQRTTYMNLAVADRKSAVVFEITPKSVGVRRPEGQVLRCTNHFELPDLTTNVGCLRYYTLGKLAEFKGEQKYSLAEVQRAMHAVNQGEMTFQTMVFEPAALRLNVVFGPGPVSNQPLHALELAPLFAPQKSDSPDSPR